MAKQENDTYARDPYLPDISFNEKLADPAQEQTARVVKLDQLKNLTQGRKLLTQEIHLTQHLMEALPVVGLNDWRKYMTHRSYT